jgi:hypothetical protein
MIKKKHMKTLIISNSLFFRKNLVNKKKAGIYQKIHQIGENSTNKIWLIIIYFFMSSVVFSQPVTKVMVSGLSGYTTHDSTVIKSFLLGYASYDGTQYTGKIDLHIDNSACAAITYASQNNYQIGIRSYTGLNSTVNDSAANHPNLLFFMPAGSNGFYFVCNLDIPNAAVVSTGAGSDSLVTGYRVEFYSIDPITNSNESSYSNGYIAGEIAFLANKLNISPQQARMLARNNALINSQSPNYVQYGQIDVMKAVNSALPVELTTFSASVNGDNVSLNWSTATEKNNYGFEVERSQISSSDNSSNTTTWIPVGFVNGHGTSNSVITYSYLDKNPPNGNLYYRLKQINNDGTYEYSKIIETSYSKPSKFELSQNYPNPFNPSTTISFQIPVNSFVTLKVYDMLGKNVATLVNENKSAGNYDVVLSANKYNLSSGIYLYVLTAGKYSLVKKFILMK